MSELKMTDMFQWKKAAKC